MTKISSKKFMAAYLLLLPNIILYILVRLIPLFGTFGLSLFRWSMVETPRFVGFANFARMWKDPNFWIAFKNTLLYTAYVVPAAVFLGLLLAVLLNKDIPGMKVFRTLFFFPYITSPVFVAMIWRSLYSTDQGLINGFLAIFGIESIPWLTSIRWALPSLAIVAVWQIVGYNMLIFLAGLQGIPKSYYESAQIDGAKRWKVFWKITVPLLRPITMFVVIINLIGALQLFDLTYIITQGGPSKATLTLVYYIYNYGFKYMRMGYASAVAIILFAIILGLSIFQRALFGRR